MAAAVTPMPHRDQLRRFILEDTPVRGQIVHLDAAWHSVLSQADYPEPVGFHCSCSRQRIESVLLGLGYRGMEETLRECDPVEVICEFCNQRYAFDALDIEALFAGALPVGLTRH